MRIKGLISLTTLVTLSVAAGCGEKGDSQKSGKAASSESKPAPASLAYKPIGSLGIEVNVPADAEVEDKTASAHFPTATLWTTPTVFVTGQNEMFWAADVEAAKREIQKDANPFKEFTKEQVTEGGFHLEYALESLMDKKPLYGFRMRVTIAGKLFDCQTNSSSVEERNAGMAICRSLRATQ